VALFGSIRAKAEAATQATMYRKMELLDPGNGKLWSRLSEHQTDF